MHLRLKHHLWHQQLNHRRHIARCYPSSSPYAHHSHSIHLGHHGHRRVRSQSVRGRHIHGNFLHGPRILERRVTGSLRLRDIHGCRGCGRQGLPTAYGRWTLQRNTNVGTFGPTGESIQAEEEVFPRDDGTRELGREAADCCTVAVAATGTGRGNLAEAGEPRKSPGDIPRWVVDHRKNDHDCIPQGAGGSRTTVDVDLGTRRTEAEDHLDGCTDCRTDLKEADNHGSLVLYESRVICISAVTSGAVLTVLFLFPVFIFAAADV